MMMKYLKLYTLLIIQMDLHIITNKQNGFTFINE